MPRQARIDAPGAVHHIICRGIDRKKIFQDDTDRNNFVLRLGLILQKTSTPCFAWALIPNHFHLLLRTGSSPISTVMERLLTGYAADFNKRHHRHGHLFQNRYKSILCQEDLYLLELVRYIHLNPLRAGIVASMEELRGYQYGGHGCLLGDAPRVWQATGDVLGRFDPNVDHARIKYDRYVFEGIGMGKRPELIGGGLLRSAGGWEKIQSARKLGEHLKSDERILGDSDFVEGVLREANESLDERFVLSEKKLTVDDLAVIAARALGIEEAAVWEVGHKPSSVQAKYLICHWGREIGLPLTGVGKRLNLSQSGASRAAQHGEELARKNGWGLKTLLEV